MTRELIVLGMLVSACGGAHDVAHTASRAPTQNPLPCAGQTRQASVPVPELGLLPSGESVTAGMQLRCSSDALEVLDWGPDSSASYVVPRAHAMEIWTAFEGPGTPDERRLRVQIALDRAQR